MPILLHNSNDVYVRGFRAAEDDEYKGDAVMTFTVYDKTPAESIVDNLEDVSMPLVDGSTDGHYRGAFSASLKFNKGEKYKVVVNCSNYEYQRVFDNVEAVENT